MFRHRSRCLAVALGLAALVSAVEARAAEPAAVAHVRYRSSSHVYLDAGTVAGLAVGDRLEAWRGGQRIASLEVIFAAGRSSTCRILEAGTALDAGDTILRAARPLQPGSIERAATAATGTRNEAGRQPPATARVEAQADTAPRSRPWALATGNVSARFASLSDSGEAGRSVRELGGAATVRLRELGGRPYDLALRVRGRRITREEDYLSGLVPATESRDRLYELALRYDPEDGFFGYQVGRVAVRPFVGVGYVDGLVASARPSSWLQVGGVAGVTPAVDGLAVSGDRKMGGFAWLRPGGMPGGHRLDLVVAGVREDYGEVTRDYLSAEVRHFAGSAWYLFGRTELDLDRPGGGSGLASLSVGASRQLGDAARLSLSYDRRRDSWPGATLFDDTLLVSDFRSSFRGSLSVGSRAFTVTARGGTRTGGTFGSTAHGGLSVSARLPLIWLTASGNYFSGDLADGLTVHGRVTRAFRAGHSLSLFYVGSRYDSGLVDTRRSTHRYGIQGWFELPRRLFLDAELEKGAGDDLDTLRGEIGLGIRF